MLIVSNISEGIAVIEDGEISFDIPAGALPDNAKEGDVILWENGEYPIDEKATAERRSKIIEMQNNLWE
ncbi:MAG: DUF3006 domain-containing protein [Oscillospiraceae bacterium]|nr:DUF3006 domain-containing protein [Oscillospiraceae bacterium]